MSRGQRSHLAQAVSPVADPSPAAKVSRVE